MGHSFNIETKGLNIKRLVTLLFSLFLLGNNRSYPKQIVLLGLLENP